MITWHTTAQRGAAHKTVVGLRYSSSREQHDSPERAARVARFDRHRVGVGVEVVLRQKQVVVTLKMDHS